jgi:hypothetical protein
MGNTVKLKACWRKKRLPLLLLAPPGPREPLSLSGSSAKDLKKSDGCRLEERRKKKQAVIQRK